MHQTSLSECVPNFQNLWRELNLTKVLFLFLLQRMQLPRFWHFLKTHFTFAQPLIICFFLLKKIKMLDRNANEKHRLNQTPHFLYKYKIVKAFAQNIILHHQGFFQRLKATLMRQFPMWWMRGGRTLVPFLETFLLQPSAPTHFILCNLLDALTSCFIQLIPHFPIAMEGRKFHQEKLTVWS